MAKANLNYEVPAHLKREFVFQTAGILPPNGILFGFNTITKVGEQAKKLGGKQVLLVTDEVMVQLGYADLVKENLEKEGLKVGVYGKVDPEPHIETADALDDLVRKKTSNLVIGFGRRQPPWTWPELHLSWPPIPRPLWIPVSKKVATTRPEKDPDPHHLGNGE
jgi:hypothetical protein